MTTSVDLQTILAAIPTLSQSDLAAIRGAADQALLPMEEQDVLTSARALTEALGLSDIAYIEVVTSEWDNGHFYDSRTARFFTADKQQVTPDPERVSAVDLDFTFLNEALTDLTNGRVGSNSTLEIGLAKNHLLGDY